MKSLVFLLTGICSFSLQAVIVERPEAGEVAVLEFDPNTYTIDPSMQKYIGSDNNIINIKGRRLYKFHNTKIGAMFLCESDGYWRLVTEENKEICHFRIYVFPSRQDAMKKAMSEPPMWPYESFNDKIMEVIREREYTRIRFRSKNEDKSDTFILEKKGVLLYELVWYRPIWNGTAQEGDRLLMQVMDVVLSGKEQPDYSEELRAIRVRQNEERNIRSYPGYRMDRSIGSSYTNEKFYSDLPEGDRTFIHPQKMWNRPSLSWFGQFEKSLLNNKETSWNERGDVLTLTFPATKTRKAYRCTIGVAHATSEYFALRFLEGLDLEGLSFRDTRKVEARIRARRVDALSLGEHNLSNKPQLDRVGSLIPHSEESDIGFVRNNTAVNVVADRPDVSVLAIARKIDEELVAAGKGEPPTWSPPKAKPSSRAPQRK